MLNKNVCPKCGQLYDLEFPACPVCGTPAQVLNDPNQQPVQRRRLTEAERRQRQQDNKRAEAEARRQQREARRAADAAEERELEEEEERLREERRRKRMERRGMAAADNGSEQGSGMPAKERRQRIPKSQKPKGPPVPAAFSIISIILLVIALAIGGMYLLWRAGKLSFPLFDKLAGVTETEQPAEERCEGIRLDASSIDLTAAGETYPITCTLEPADCKLPVSYQTSDETVAMVGELGIVTAVGPGTATITVSCGDKSAEMTVHCSFEQTTATESGEMPEKLELNNSDMTFDAPNQSFDLLVTNLPVGTEVFWASSDEKVATVAQNGHVVAVGPGNCYITAVVNDITESCIVRCTFETSETTANTEG